MNTTSLGFKKPAGTDPVDIQDFNDNADIMERELQARPKKDGSASDMTVTFSEAGTLTELTSNASLKNLFGKLKLTVKNVISILKLLGNGSITSIGDGTVTGAIVTLNSNLTWKKLTPSHKTGTVSVNLPENFQELCVKVNINGLNVVVQITIPYISLQSTVQSFRGGYYYAANANGTASLLTSTSSISLEWAYLNGSVVTAATNWIVYYR